VSSYTPTLEALCLARKDMPIVTKVDTRVLVVAESSAPGMPRLLSVEEEIRAVQKHLSVDVIGMEERSYGQGPAKAQIATVLSAIPDSPILHLACHGRQDLENPLESGFMLSDGILTVRKLMSLDLKNAFLAFLSACETAKGDPQHPDQNFHLAAAMLFVGFRSVIATMWSVKMFLPAIVKPIYVT
jgi:CHAT domain-containing protein